MEKQVDIVFVSSASGAWMMGGAWRDALSRTQWQAVVIPTLAANANKGIFPRRLEVALGVPITPEVPTRAGAMAALERWARVCGYGKLEVLELCPPMSDDDRQLLAALKRAVWPSPVKPAAAPIPPPPGKPQRHPAFLL